MPDYKWNLSNQYIEVIISICYNMDMIIIGGVKYEKDFKRREYL